MSVRVALPGLDHYLSVCIQFDQTVEKGPPLEGGPRVGEPFLGYPCDPQLATLLARMNGGLLGDFQMYELNITDYDIVKCNTNSRSFPSAEPIWSEIIVYAKTYGLAYDF